MACRDLDLWSANSNQVFSRDKWIIPVNFMRYRGNKICPDEWTNAANGQPENMTPLPTMFSGKSIIKTVWSNCQSLKHRMDYSNNCFWKFCFKPYLKCLIWHSIWSTVTVLRVGVSAKVLSGASFAAATEMWRLISISASSKHKHKLDCIIRWCTVMHTPAQDAEWRQLWNTWICVYSKDDNTTKYKKQQLIHTVNSNE